MTRNVERPGPPPLKSDPSEADLAGQTASPGQAIGFLFKSLHLSLRHAMDEALRGRGLQLSFAHFATLFGLDCEPGSTGAQLARRSMVSPQTMNPVLRRLEAEGLIERRPHPDSRRADSWFMTGKGSEQFHAARGVAEAVFSRMLSALSDMELQHLQDYLRRCVAALGEPPAEEADVKPVRPRKAASPDL
ncbi:MAG TPA: MarR family transcriptional regulator [Gammaproteobacteria bacterium]|nr:MarR family transcriptional regulator [Gammaproteobacteria bacterium]